MGRRTRPVRRTEPLTAAGGARTVCVRSCEVVCPRIRPPPEDRVEVLLARLQALDKSDRTARCPLLVGVGAAVLDVLFGGSAQAFRAQAARSSELRRALRDPRFPVAPTKITLAVRLAEQQGKLGSLALRLSCSHQIELLVVADDLRRTDLAERSIAEGWSARTLAVRVRADALASRPATGRPRVPPDERLVRELVARVRASALAAAVAAAPESRRRAHAERLADAAQELLRLADAIVNAGEERPFRAGN